MHRGMAVVAKREIAESDRNVHRIAMSIKERSKNPCKDRSSQRPKDHCP
jgi:hypothetical protein